MKQTISNSKIDISSNQRKKHHLISEIPIKYIIIDKSNVIKPLQKLMQFSLVYLKFDVNENPNIYPSNSSKLVKVKHIQLLRYSSKNSLFCLTLNNKCYNKLFSSIYGEDLFENSIWFCIDIHDFSEYKNTYQAIVNLYCEIFPVESLSDSIYNKFKNTMYKRGLKNEKEFVNDWSCFISPTFNSFVRYTRKLSKLRITHENGTVPPCTSQNSEIIDDLNCLKTNSCLNDKIIDFYLKYIYKEMLGDEDKDRSYFFNLFFNTKLIGTDAEQQNDTADTRHARVKKWTKNVDIFSKDFIFIPVIEDTHWFIVTVCFPWMVGMIDYCKLFNPNRPYLHLNIPKNETFFATEFRVKKLESLKEKMKINPMPCILIFDSYGKSAKNRISKVKIIREYLRSEWDSKRVYTDGPLVFDRSTCRGISPKVPQQTNAYDCGIYLLLYVEYFFKVPIVDFNVDYLKFDLFQWFNRNDAKRKRIQIRDLIKKEYL